MMKKWTAIALMTAMLALGMGGALAGTDGEHYIDMGTEIQQIIFSVPRLDYNKVIGTFYSGVGVTVLGEEENGMLHVAIGDGTDGPRIEGYMENDGLTPLGEPARKVMPNDMAAIGVEALALRDAASHQATAVAEYPRGTQVRILGETGSWKYVEVDGRRGYMHTYSLSPWQNDEYSIEIGFVQTGGAGAPFYLGEDDGEPVATYYDGALVYVEELLGARARVTFGEFTRGTEGYVNIADIVSDISPNLLAGRQPIMRITGEPGQTITMRKGPSDGADEMASYPVGARVSVMGVWDGWANVTVGVLEGYLPLEHLEATGETAALSDRAAQVPPLGYMTVSAKDPDSEGEDSMLYVYLEPDEEAAKTLDIWRARDVVMQVLADCGDWMQVRVNLDFDQGYVKKDQPMEVLWLADWVVPEGTAVLEGAYVAGEDIPAGLYTYRAAKAGDSILIEGDAGTQRFTPDAGAPYTVLARAGDQVTITGDGGMEAMEPGHVIGGDGDWTYSGTGRYLVGVQTPAIDAVAYSGEVLDGAQGGYVTVSPGIWADGGIPEAVTYMLPTAEGSHIPVAIGEFIEIVDGYLVAFFGNG